MNEQQLKEECPDEFEQWYAIEGHWIVNNKLTCRKIWDSALAFSAALNAQPDAKRIFEAVKKAAIKACDDKADELDEKEGHKWAEQQRNGMEGCQLCAEAIEALTYEAVIKAQP